HGAGPASIRWVADHRAELCARAVHLHSVLKVHHAATRVVSVGAGTVARLIAAAIALAACSVHSATAATIYVRQTGDDANDGLSPQQAVRQITRAAARAQAGDRIVVGRGIYTEGNITPAAFGRVSFI